MFHMKAIAKQYEKNKDKIWKCCCELEADESGQNTHSLEREQNFHHRNNEEIFNTVR